MLQLIFEFPHGFGTVLFALAELFLVLLEMVFQWFDQCSDGFLSLGKISPG